ncbi:hypothetical protein POVCU1_018020 [Plasmodium ovale curtisi]|uniref:Uncharacterized protein n=1 Tax=Plasmodium ovale curtisi TaxID=864141 RepID=A0A1A8WGE7_PLAOA|nr:hypothetical protein POVCU1_018020 [Plasmodium ovale curtisi]
MSLHVLSPSAAISSIYLFSGSSSSLAALVAILYLGCMETRGKNVASAFDKPPRSHAKRTKLKSQNGEDITTNADGEKVRKNAKQRKIYYYYVQTALCAQEKVHVQNGFV